MKTKFSLSKTISIISIFFILLLSSCDGFFQDNQLENKISAAIEYANTPYSTFVVSADTSAGTIIPNGQVQYKPTDFQNIEFTLKPSYQFIKWRFSYKMISQGSEDKEVLITDENWWKDYITIVKQSESEPNLKGEITYSLQIKFLKAQENLLIEPVCSLKPQLKSWSGQLGEIQSRNASLSFVFNSKLDIDSCIYFTNEEIASIANAQPLKNGLNKIYGYTLNGETFFKNIEIKYKNRNINASYCDFRYKDESNTLIITPDTTKPFDITDDFAEVEITFKDGIKNPDGASMSESTVFINVNKYSDERSLITTYTNTSKNPDAVAPARDELYLQEKKTITFTQTDLTQFLYWSVSSHSEYPDSVNSIITDIDSEDPAKITFWGIKRISSEEEVSVSAVYKYRPKITSFVTYKKNDINPKDSDIEITFDENINLQSFKSGYKILCNGNDVTANFKTPYFTDNSTAESGKIIKIEADQQNRLDVDAGTQKTITVIIPSTVFYQTTEEDGKTYNITLGKDVSKSYMINSSTRNKTYIQFSANSSYGSTENFNISNMKTYNIGESVTFKFIEKADWQFIGWNKTGDANNNIIITKSEADPNTYTFKIAGASGSEDHPINISAVATPKIKLESIKLKKDTSTTYYDIVDTQVYPKDCNIQLTFNTEVDLQSFKDDYKIFCDGVDISSYYNAPVKQTDNDKVILLTPNPNRRLIVDKDTTKNISVFIPSTLKYEIEHDGTTIPVYLGKDISKAYTINYTTCAKTYVKFNIPNVTIEGISKNAQGYSEIQEYSIGERISLNITEDYGWEIVNWNKQYDYNSVSFYRTNPTTYTLYINDAGGTTSTPITINAITRQCLEVKDISPETTGGTTVPCDTDIEIWFNKKPDLNSCKSQITIKYNGINAISSFPTSGWTVSDITDSNGWYKLTIPADKNNRILIDSSAVIEVSFNQSLCYKDGSYSVHYISESYSHNYNINSETTDKLQLNFRILDIDNTVNPETDPEIEGTIITNSTDNTFSVGKIIPVEFIPDSNYEFCTWDSGDGGYDYVNFGNYTKTKTNITIKKSRTQPLDIYAQCVEKLSASLEIAVEVDSVTGAPVTTFPPDDEQSYPKDSIILLTFNKPIPDSLQIKDYVTIKNDGKISTFRYLVVNPDDDKMHFYFLPNSYIQFDSNTAENATQVVEVTISPDLYYLRGSKKIYMNDDRIKTFTINKTTRAKPTIRMQTNLNQYKVYLNGNEYTGNTNQLIVNIDEEFSINCIPNDGYEFMNWSGSSGNLFIQNQLNGDASTIAKIVGATTMNDTITIKPNIVPKLPNPQILVNWTEYEYSDLATYTDRFPKDSQYIIIFDRIIDHSNSKYFHLKYNGLELIGTYYDIQAQDVSTETENRTYFGLIPKASKILNNPDNAQLELIINKEISYKAKNEEKYCLKYLNQVRKHGINAEIYPDAAKIQKQMKYANQRAIPIVVIAGEQEVAEQKFTVKWMKEGTQETVDANKLVETIFGQ